MNDPLTQYFSLGVIVLVFIMSFLASRAEMPVFQVVGRWLRWVFFALVFAGAMKFFDLSFRPDWVHFVTGLALWFLLETGYNWLLVKALSQSEIPLFPTFRTNLDGDEWPADERLIKVKDWLRQNGYTCLSALKAKLFDETYLRASIYESSEKTTRIQILFIPKQKGDSRACFTVTTLGQKGRRLITDNHFLPFGGYYPEGWSLVRKPLIGSLTRIICLHHKRLLKSDLVPMEFEDDPLKEINDQQRILERLNIETGFLVPRPQQEEYGKITREGRYRLWKEMWTLAYFGKPGSSI